MTQTVGDTGLVSFSAPAPAGHARTDRGGHLGAVDVVRFLTILGVIVVHATSLVGQAGPHATAGGTVASGAVLVVLHVTRNVFLMLSAFVLGYSMQSRPLPARAFWRRRYPLVVAPYVAWSAVYLVAAGGLAGPVHAAGRFGWDLLTAGAHFHLYFLLLTFQLYLVFPSLYRFLARRPRLHAPLLVASAALQLAFTAAVQYGPRPPVIGVWLDHPGSWLPSYQLYVIGGLLAALHLDAVTAWVRGHGRLIAGALVASCLLGLGVYAAGLTLLGLTPVAAGAVFQPVTVIETVAATVGQYALGCWAMDRLGARRRRQLRAASDTSFGVYLAHPLIISGVLGVAGWAGLGALLGAWPGAAVEALVVLGLMPLTYAVTVAGIAVSRATPLSLVLTGRRRRGPVSAPGPEPTPASFPLIPVPSASDA